VRLPEYIRDLERDKKMFRNQTVSRMADTNDRLIELEKYVREAMEVHFT
jgi:hypothetical protein